MLSFMNRNKMWPTKILLYMTMDIDGLGQRIVNFWTNISVVNTGLPLSVITLKPRQNGRHFADDILKRIFLKGNVRISIEISVKFVS